LKLLPFTPNDYLFYINNLLYILHRQKKFAQALEIATEAIPNTKQSNSFYNRIGFTALYIRTLNNTKQAQRAVNYAQSFFEAYKKEIFDYRWHLFFTAFFEALLLQEKYSVILSYCKRYQLVKLEKKDQKLKYQNNILYWFSLFSEYMTAKISEAKIKKAFKELIDNKNTSPENKHKIELLIKEMKSYFPEFIRFINESVPQEEFIF
jgi:archaellum biogenesis protein FlaJ (TadC family)